MDTDITTTAGTLRKLERDLLSTTALAVLDYGSARLARSSVLASSSVLHLVVELDIGVLGHRDLVLIDGEVLIRTTGQAGSTAR